MKIIATSLLSLISSLALANTPELIAKCSSDLEIKPGMQFVYVYKIDSGLGVVESIAHTSDNLASQSQTLKADHPIRVATIENGNLTWTKALPSDGGDTNFLSLSSGDSLWVTTGTPFTTIGSNSFTEFVYPTCVQWKSL